MNEQVLTGRHWQLLPSRERCGMQHSYNLFHNDLFSQRYVETPGWNIHNDTREILAYTQRDCGFHTSLEIPTMTRRQTNLTKGRIAL